MSSELGMEFGHEHGDAYGEVISKWAKRLKGVNKVSEATRKEWGSDLRSALGATVTETLVGQITPGWKKVGDLPSEETITRFAQIAVKTSLEKDTKDLLERLRTMAQRTEPEEEALTSDGFLVSQAVKRSSQTVAQIVDMVVDRFNGIMERFFGRKGNLTGRRRWQATSDNSRHSGLHGQIKEEGENFSYKGDSIYGPRPPGGSPENWSNCSCRLEREKIDGSWVSIT